MKDALSWSAYSHYLRTCIWISWSSSRVKLWMFHSHIRPTLWCKCCQI